MSLRLYSYFRSSAAYRVRIALNLKALDYTIVSVNLAQGEQRGESYLALNPQGLVPALELGDGRLLTQSPAILEWLESTYPAPALLPEDAFERARVRAWCSAIACDIHPLNNLRVLNYLSGPLVVSDEQKTAWYHHWLAAGFASLEKQLVAAPFCHGTEPGLADAYLIPQIYNALRFHFDMQAYPRLLGIYQRCLQLDAFVHASPESQPDRP